MCNGIIVHRNNLSYPHIPEISDQMHHSHHPFPQLPSPPELQLINDDNLVSLVSLQRNHIPE